jgi:hypothetical protein
MMPALVGGGAASAFLLIIAVLFWRTVRAARLST